MADSFGIHESALLLHAKRTSIIAANIANADTPGYKAQDLDFKSVLKGKATQVVLSKSSSGHIGLKASGGVKYINPYAPSLDGNTVDVEQEKMKMMEANQRYSASLEFLNGAIKGRLQVIKGD